MKMNANAEIQKDLILSTLVSNQGTMHSGELYQVLKPLKVSRGKFLQLLAELKQSRKLTYPSFFAYESRFRISLVEPKEAVENVQG